MTIKEKIRVLSNVYDKELNKQIISRMDEMEFDNNSPVGHGRY